MQESDSARAAYFPQRVRVEFRTESTRDLPGSEPDVRNIGYSMTKRKQMQLQCGTGSQREAHQADRDSAGRSKGNAYSCSEKSHCDVGRGYPEATGSQGQLDLLDLSVAQQSSRSANRYSAGEATALEVVDAQAASLSAGTAREDGAVRYQTALAELQLLSGTL